ncbi:MAG: hypothetical protein IJ099_03980 [Alphaproteobacteria bacterium]|nr:hypothetical protein [Alphaproteobacteria bacterium]
MPRKNTQYVGDCSLKGVAKKAYEVAKRSNAQNPAKTGNFAVDFTAGKIPLVKGWNRGFNLGKAGFIAKQTYNETCKRKK